MRARITPEHLERQRQFHRERPPGAQQRYGISGHKWAERVMTIANHAGCCSLLDYGCGDASLERGLRDLGSRMQISSFDPVTAPDTELVPHDMVVCTDVLEQVEAQFLDKIIQDLSSLAEKCLFIAAQVHPPEKWYPGLNTDRPEVWVQRFDNLLSGRWSMRIEVKQRPHHVIVVGYR